MLPLLLILAIIVLWFWRPWQPRQPQAETPVEDTPTATPLPTATYRVAPTATPLNSPTPLPTMTLPPNQVYHTVEANETASSIAKLYGTTAKAILQANGLKESSVLRVGQQLIIPLPVADTPTPSVTPTPSATPFLYTVKSGDMLSVIAKRFGTTVEALMEANGIEDATRLKVGTQLIIVQPPDYSATMAYETYVVQQGDTLYTIAAKYGLSIAEIKEANGLTSNNLKVAQELRIPVGTATPTSTLTPTPSLTPTPAPPRPAPVLLAPADGVAFEGADTVILLNWASVGILPADEWYVLRVERVGVWSDRLYEAWTKATSWRVPTDWLAAGPAGAQRFRWQVMVERQTGVDDKGMPLGEPISPPGEVRTFSWK